MKHKIPTNVHTACQFTHFRNSCSKMYIPEHLNELFQSDEIRRAEMNLAIAIEHLKDELVLRNKCKTELKDIKDKAANAMEIYIKEIHSTVEELKKEVSASLEKLIGDVDAEIESQISEMETNLSTAEEALEDTKRASNDGCNESQQYVCGRMADAAARDCKIVNERLCCPSVHSITFKPYLSCENLFRPLLQYKSFGVFIIEQNNAKSRSRRNKRMGNVHMAVDKQTSCIIGSCSLSDDSILLTDTSNHRLKRIVPNQLVVSDHLDLPAGYDTPWSVCATSQLEAAVTLPDTKQVQFVSIEKTMEKTRTMSLDYRCYGIAYNHGELYVSDRHTTVFVYTIAGKPLRQFSKDKSADRLFSNIHNMTVSECESVLYVADSVGKLIAIDTKTGHKVWQYTAADLDGARGVCVDGRGSVFVCGYDSHNLLQISESGEKIVEVLTKIDGILYPRSVCFSRDRTELVVTSTDDKITMVSLLDI